MTVREVNFDRLIGPSHHYGGLSTGNLASTRHRHQVSSPKRAALQGLEKMKRLADFGIPQAVLPPQHRPSFTFLKDRGFDGGEADVLREAALRSPETLSLAYSASAMWVANAATVSPSADTADGRVHLTVANLFSMPHRRLEAEETTQVLRRMFHDTTHFVVHDPLPQEREFADEGAANHTRFCRQHGTPGVELFVYGREGDEPESAEFPARQSRQAFERIAQQHQLDETRQVFARQHPAAIAAGAFHNDVVAVGNEHVHLIHEHALVDQPSVVDQINGLLEFDLITIEVPDEQVSLANAVRTYLFNSQLLSTDDGMLLLCPSECERSTPVHSVIDRILSDEANPIQRCEFLDLTESMQNGGGPACLRLRVVLAAEQREALPKSIWLNEGVYQELRRYVRQHYRDELALEELADPRLAIECRSIAAEVTDLLLR